MAKVQLESKYLVLILPIYSFFLYRSTSSRTTRPIIKTFWYVSLTWNLIACYSLYTLQWFHIEFSGKKNFEIILYALYVKTSCAIICTWNLHGNLCYLLILVVYISAGNRSGSLWHINQSILFLFVAYHSFARSCFY